MEYHHWIYTGFKGLSKGRDAAPIIRIVTIEILMSMVVFICLKMEVLQ